MSKHLCEKCEEIVDRLIAENTQHRVKIREIECVVSNLSSTDGLGIVAAIKSILDERNFLLSKLFEHEEFERHILSMLKDGKFKEAQELLTVQRYVKKPQRSK